MECEVPMSSVDFLKKIKQEIISSLPRDAQITNVEFEGPEIAVYSKNPDIIGEENQKIKEIAKEMRKRIVIRSDESIRLEPKTAMELIQQIVPAEAEITNIFFDENLGDVIIEAKKPGLVIGKEGKNLKTIRKQTYWKPDVIRTPPLKSKTVDLIRGMLKKEKEEQKKILIQIGERIHRPQVFNTSNIKLTFLGGFKEVGRSCIYVQTDESNVLLDCGMNVGNPSQLFPFIDIKDFCIEDLDAVIITHAHMDHSGLVPFLYKYDYSGPTYCTLPTKHLMTMLQLDYCNLTEKDGRISPYQRRDIKTTVLHTYPIVYGKVIDIAPDIKLTLHNSGHILGSAMAHLHFGTGEHNLIYTGDYKFQKSRLLDVANTKFPRLETLITESTYGGSQDNIPSRIESEKRLIAVVNKTLEKGGKLLIPVLAVGRAQELMVQLEDFISREMIKKVPIYIDGLISEATAIHTTHPDLLNSDLRELIFHQQKNPFMSDVFTTVDSSDAREEIVNGGPCIIMATSGMLQGGPSLGYLKALAEDENSTLLFVSYQVEGTLGRRIQKGYREFVVKLANGKGLPIKINMNVQTISGFSGHSSRSQIISFIRKVNPKPDKIIVNHGEASRCVSLAALVHKRLKIETKAPLNKETIIL